MYFYCIYQKYRRYVQELFTNYKKIDIEEYGAAAQSRQSAWRFLQSSELGLPHPLTPWRVCPPFSSGWGGGGKAHSLAGERGSPF
jgi:hypothetical protein